MQVEFLILPLLIYGALFFCVWKFYQVLTRINDNIAGIKRALDERGVAIAPTSPVAADAVKCPACGLVNPASAQLCDCGHDLSNV